LVYALENRWDVVAVGNPGNLDSDLPGEFRLLFLAEVGNESSGHTEQFAVVIDFPLTRQDGLAEDCTIDRNHHAAEVGERREDKPMLVSIAQLLEEPQKAAVRMTAL